MAMKKIQPRAAKARALRRCLKKLFAPLTKTATKVVP